MFNLLNKELKLGIIPFFYILPFLTGALMLIPGWLYFLVTMYFCFITVPTLFSGYRAQNDLTFSILMPVSKNDIVKARVLTIVILELLHVVIAMVFGVISNKLYPNLTSFFFKPSLGLFGLCLVMLGIFNIILLIYYYKTAYKYGIGLIIANAAIIVFAVASEWLGISNGFVYNVFKGTHVNNTGLHLGIFIVGLLIFAIMNIMTYVISAKEFEKVDI